VIGIDTTYLIQLSIEESEKHDAAKRLSQKLGGTGFALTPQVLAEYIHIVTDAKRFTKPLAMSAAVEKSEEYWNAAEVSQIFPTSQSIELMHRWLTEHKLGRKRILDTQLAATYYTAGIKRILSSNGRDFTVFGAFEILEP